MIFDIERLITRIKHLQSKKVDRIGMDIVGKIEGSLHAQCPVPAGDDGKRDAKALLNWVAGVLKKDVEVIEPHAPKPLSDKDVTAISLNLPKRAMSSMREVEPNLKTVADLKELIVDCNGDLTKIAGLSDGYAKKIHERLLLHDENTPGCNRDWFDRVSQHQASRDSERFADPDVTNQPETTDV